MVEAKQMSHNVKFQKDSIEEKLKNAKFSTIDLEMCNGDILHISPVSYTDILSIKDIEYLLVDVVSFDQRRNVPFMSCDTISELAKKVCNYHDLVKESEKSATELDAFYKEHIEGRVLHDKQKAEQIFACAYKEHTEKSFEDVVMELAASAEEKADVKLMLDSQYYSDWHKSVYGCRPR